jgi:hypothetical protein
MRSTPASDDGKSEAAAFADDDDKSKPSAILKTASAFASNRASRAAAFPSDGDTSAATAAAAAFAFAGDVISAAAESQAPAFAFACDGASKAAAAFAGDGESKQQLCLQVMAKNLHLQLQTERGKAPPPDQCHCNSSRASRVGTDLEVQEIHEDGSPGVKLCLAVVVASAALRRAAKSGMMLKRLLLRLRLVLLVS